MSVPAASDAHFPALHIRPPQGWLNDPNGVCRIDGRWHVFFQYNPMAPTHGDIHWGHVSSPDLLSWTEEPIALSPRPGAVDAGGCWSGCVVDDVGVPAAVYTGVSTSAADAGVVLARSDRTLRHWQQGETRRVGVPETAGIEEVRDPYLVEIDGHRYAVQGAGSAAGPPRLLLYGCDDLTAWTELGTLLDHDDPVAAEVAPANIWECPNLFRLGGRWVLVVSLWRADGDGQSPLVGVRYLLGDLEPAGAGFRFRASSGGVLDTGPTFYAPQVLVETDRVLAWGWAWEGVTRGLEEIEAAGWAGVLTFPRELELSGGELVSRPARELERLRREQLDWAPDVAFRARAFEVEASGPVRLRLAAGEVADLVVTTDGPARIFVDGSVVETFSAGRVSTDRVYPGPGSGWVVEAPATQVRLWRLGC